MKTLNTERVMLRKFQPQDLAELYAYTRIVGLGECAGWKHHEKIAEAQEMLKRFIHTGVWAIVEKNQNQVIGHVAVQEDSEEGRTDTKELGFVLHPAYQRQGLMLEAVNAVLADLFAQGVVYVYACCFQHNLASKGLIEKCGFLLEQEGEFFSPSLNKTFSSYEYLMTKERWAAFR